jgi:hypothetical protein
MVFRGKALTGGIWMIDTISLCHIPVRFR